MKTVKSYKQIGKVQHTLLTMPVGDGVDEKGNVTDVTYRVRGLSPLEVGIHSDILTSVTPPSPPVKKRTVVPVGGKLQASQIETEDYADMDDPTFKDAIKAYEEEYKTMVQRASMYRLMMAVEGFDISDEDIKTELEEEAVSDDSIDNLCKRIDQVCRIILPEFDQRHMMGLLSKIGELSGVQTERVNFI